MRDQLAETIRSRCVRRGEFTLASGEKSDIYVDLKKVLLDPECLEEIADRICYKTHALTYEAVGGMEMGAVPIATSVALIASARYGDHLDAFFVRKSRKDHGTTVRVESVGSLDGKRCLIVEDVTTSGASALDVVRILRAEGAHVDRVVTVLDRQQGAAEAMAVENVELTALFTMTDLLG